MSRKSVDSYKLLRLAASISTRAVAPSAILKKLAASPNPSQLAKALRELGRIERSLFMIEWYSSLSLRRRCQAGLNKGEAAHKLKHAVFFHARGEIRDRSFEGQAFRASGLNLVVSATRSRTCSASSKNGGASQPAMTGAHRPPSPPLQREFQLSCDMPLIYLCHYRSYFI